MRRRHWVALQVLLIAVMVVVATRTVGTVKVLTLGGLLVLVVVVAVASRVHTSRSLRQGNTEEARGRRPG